MFARKKTERPNGERSLAVFLPSGPLVVPGTHPNFDEIFAAVESDASEEEIENLADVAKAVALKLMSLSERVKVDVDEGVVYFDGDRVHNALAEHVLDTLDQGEDFQPLVNFWEKIAQNPNERSRDQLFSWLAGRKFTIAPDGDFYAYKGCATDSAGNAVSVHHGKAIVDGKPVNGAVPNAIGSVIEFPRSEADSNPAHGCSRGLHVGDFDYAKGWARGVLLLAKVNPRDVVSVPADSSYAKVRTTRYEVVDTFTQPQALGTAVYASNDDPDDYAPVEGESWE